MTESGDYISREAAYQFFKDQLEKETGAFSKGRNAGLRVAMSAVMNNDAIPAADVRPVRRREWLPIIEGNEYGETYQSGCYCSECGEVLQHEPNFCPNCGADMRKES